MSHQKVQPTARQKRFFVLHLIVFLVVNIIIWYVRNHMMAVEHRWVYPLPAWITAAWGLAVIGHACSLWSNYEDDAYTEFIRQTKNG